MSWAGKSKFIWKYYLQTDSLKLRQNLWRLTVPGVLRFFYIVQIKEIQAFKGKSTLWYYFAWLFDFDQSPFDSPTFDRF